MKKKLILFISIVLLSFLFTACSTQKTNEIKKPFLYEISKDGKVSYLFGTIHRGVDSREFHGSMWKYFDNADALATESDEKMPRDLQDAFAERLIRKNDQPKLSNVLNKDDFLTVKETLKNNEIVSNNLDNFSLEGICFLLRKNKLLNNQATLSKTEQEISMSKSQLDSQLRSKAKAQAKEIIALDNIESAVSFLIGLEGKPAKEAIQNILRSNNDSNAKTKSSTSNEVDIVKAYRESNEEYINMLFSDLPSWVLKTRNEQWTQMMISLMEKYTSVFFAVGVSHIVVDAPYSLIRILEMNGYKIRRMTDADFKI